MDLKRITSGAIVVIAVLILLIIPNNLIVNLLLTAVAVVATHEYLKAISKVCNPIKWVAYLSCLIVTVINYIPEEYITKTLLFTTPILLLILFAQVIATNMKTTFKDVAYTFLGIMYIPGLIMFISLVNALENGKILFIYLLIAAFGTDTIAYTLGKRIGKHKFSKVSPKKSIEGCIAGTLGAIILTLIFTAILNNYFHFEYSYFIMAITGTVLSLIGQLGDLTASSIKRYVDIKDYGTLLPGHGGILDRIDSILFIAPFVYMLLGI